MKMSIKNKFIPLTLFAAIILMGRKSGLTLDGLTLDSFDGINWVPSPGGLPSSDDWSSVAYGNGTFVAVASGSSSAAYSTDGAHWAASTMSSSAGWDGVSYGSTNFVAVSSKPVSHGAWSTNGVDWTESGMTGDYTSVTYGSGKFVAVSPPGSNVVYSTDGIHWSNSTLPFSANWSCITIGK